MSANGVAARLPSISDRLRRELARDLAAGVVQSLHRLLKAAQLHAHDNEAVRRLAGSTAETLREYRERTERAFSIAFVRGAIFVAGQPLKGSRVVYEQAREIGAALQRCGAGELTLDGEAQAATLRDWIAAVVAAQRGAHAGYDPPDDARRHVHLRAIDLAALGRGLEIEPLDDEQRIVRAYAGAIVLLRHVLERLHHGDVELPRRIKRVAQTLVDLSAGKTPAFLGVTAVRNANHDDAGKSVNSAILAVAMARQITDDRIALQRIAMAAMMHDVGRPRAVRAMRLETDDDDAPQMSVTLGDEAERSLPAGTAAVLLAAGRLNEPTIVRSVVAYEALWLARQRRLGPVHRGARSPTLHARIVAMSRRFIELLTPAPGETPRCASDALLELDAEVSAAPGTGRAILGDAVDRTVLRLLIGALGVLPPGTLVELSTGEIAVIVTSGAAGDATGPTLRVVLDENGAMPDRPHDVAFADANARIVKIVGSDPSFVRRAPTLDTPIPASFPPPSEARVIRPVATSTAPPKIIELAHLEEDEPISSSKPLPVPSPASPPPPDRPADVTGPLATTPVPHLLVHLLGRGLSGTLVVTHRDRSPQRFSFVAGAPAHSGSPDALLGRFVELSRRPDDGTYAFYAENPGDRPTCDPLAIILAVVRAWGDKPESAARMESTLQKLGATPIVLHAASDADRFAFTPAETLVLDAAREFELPYPSLLDAALAPISVVRSLVYVLAVTRHLALGIEGAWPMGVARPSRPPIDLPPPSARAEAFRASISPPAPPVVTKVAHPMIERAHHVADEDFYQALGVAEDASATDVEQAFHRLAKQYHPDRVPPELRDAAAKIFAHLARAHETLFDARWRAAYDAQRGQVQARTEDDATVERVLQASTEAQKAEVLSRRGDLVGAEALAARAVQLDPETTDHRVLLAWIRAQRATDKMALLDPLTLLDAVIDEVPDDDRALYYRGTILKRLGRNNEAIRDFRIAADLNPKNVDALREVRLWNMRVEAARDAEKKGGLRGLFKK